MHSRLVIERDAPDELTGNVVAALNQPPTDRRHAMPAGYEFDAEGWELITEAAAGTDHGIERLVAGFKRYGIDVLTAACQEVDRIVESENPGYTGTVVDGAVRIVEAHHQP